MSLRATTIALFALGGCGTPDTNPVHDDELRALEDDLATLIERIDALESAHAADITSLEEELLALSGGVDLTDLNDGVAQNQDAIETLAGRVSLTEADIQALGNLVEGLENAQEAQDAVMDAAEVELASLADGAAAIETRVDGLAEDVAALGAGLDAVDSALGGIASELDTQASELDAQASDLDALDGALDAVDSELDEIADSLAPLDYMSVDSGDLIISGTNVYIQSGVGYTADDSSGLGNLILGYADWSGYVVPVRDGAHNLIIGDEHSWWSYGGIVAGEDNSIEAAYASVLGGRDNRATAAYALVLNGYNNLADYTYSTVYGGHSQSTTRTYDYAP